MDKFVFLTRGEIHISNERCILVHLRPNDPRVDYISKNLKRINFFFINPKVSEYIDNKFPNKIKRNIWYTTDEVTFDYVTDYCGYRHYTFKYLLSKSYPWEKGGLIELSETMSPDVEKIESLKNIKYEK